VKTGRPSSGCGIPIQIGIYNNIAIITVVAATESILIATAMDAKETEDRFSFRDSQSGWKEIRKYTKG
jgi:hypothetical protein